jgi:hypothetical protein
MRVSIVVPLSTFSALLFGCASTTPHPPPSAMAPEAAQQVCAGLSDDERNRSLCLDSADLLGVERVPVEGRGGEVLSGARLTFRPAPGRTAQSLQRVIDCQVATSAPPEPKQEERRLAYCALAIPHVTAQVRQVTEGFAVEIRPSDASASNRIAHTVAHGRLAQELARFESSECKGVPPQARAACPLLGPVSAIEDIPRGVRVEFPASVSCDAVLAGMRCHYSFALARAFSAEAAACPLYVRGLRFERSLAGGAIDITMTTPDKVGELRRGVREEAVFEPVARRQRRQQ